MDVLEFMRLFFEGRTNLDLVFLLIKFQIIFILAMVFANVAVLVYKKLKLK